jgi:hypothetical protein
MTKTLEEQIKERKQQARDRKIYEKGRLVADKFGKHDEESRGGYDTLRHIFNDAANSLKVHYELCHGDWDYKEGGYNYTRHSFDIVFNDKLVFRGDGWSANSYIPGAWEKKLDDLYLKAQQIVAKEQAEAARKAAAEKAAAERKAAEEKRAKEKTERAKWGLEEDTPHDIAAERRQKLNKIAPPLKLKIA